MKLLGRDIPARELISRIEERLRTRGLPTSEPVAVPPEGVEPRVEPLTFNLHALEENSDPTRALPLHTHRGGMGQLVLVAKWAFRKSCQVFINEALGRQRVFNGHVRDSYAQLSAEVIRLRREVEELRARAAVPPAKPRAAQEGAPAAKQAPATRPPPAERASPAAKQAPRTKPAPERKPPEARTPAASRPQTAPEPVLPRPRHARDEAQAKRPRRPKGR